MDLYQSQTRGYRSHVTHVTAIAVATLTSVWVTDYATVQHNGPIRHTIGSEETSLAYIQTYRGGCIIQARTNNTACPNKHARMVDDKTRSCVTRVVRIHRTRRLPRVSRYSQLALVAASRLKLSQWDSLYFSYGENASGNRRSHNEWWSHRNSREFHLSQPAAARAGRW